MRIADGTHGLLLAPFDMLQLSRARGKLTQLFLFSIPGPGPFIFVAYD